MAIVLALLTATVYGIADFYGGLATRRARVLQVVGGSHVVGGIGSLAAAVLLAERFNQRDALLGIGGGIVGVVGVALFYRRLAAGPMSVVAPLTAITAAILPAGWGVLGGERLTAVGWLGVVLALVAVLLVSLPSATDDAAASSAPVTASVIGESLLAGAGFGGLFIFLDATSDESALWPIASSRVVTSILLIALVAVMSRRTGTSMLPPDRGAWPLIAVAGLLDTASNTLFIYATGLGQLTVVSVLASLYPVSTVVLARVVLGERMNTKQAAGFVAAMSATALLVLG